MIKLPRTDQIRRSESSSLLSQSTRPLDFPEISWPATQPSPVPPAAAGGVQRQPSADAPAPQLPLVAPELMRRRRPVAASDRKLINLAIRWMMALPRRYRPRLLALQFPHVINRLAVVWSDPALAAACFDDLMVDRRGGRIGFPRAVTEEILRLHELALARQDAAYRPAHPELTSGEAGTEWTTTLHDPTLEPAVEPRSSG